MENKKCCANIFDFKYQKNKNKNECNYAKTGNLLASAVYTSIMYIYLEEQPVWGIYDVTHKKFNNNGVQHRSYNIIMYISLTTL